jgi:acyl carrier protein
LTNVADSGYSWRIESQYGKAMNEEILRGLAEILECPVITPETVMGADGMPWDSLTIVCVIGLLDEKAGVFVDGQKLANCATVADILALAVPA